jgi:hypothetical protein
MDLMANHIPRRKAGKKFLSRKGANLLFEPFFEPMSTKVEQHSCEQWVTINHLLPKLSYLYALYALSITGILD